MAYVQNCCTKEQAIRTTVDIGSFPLCSNLHIWLCSLCDDFSYSRSFLFTYGHSSSSVFARSLQGLQNIQERDQVRFFGGS